MSRRYFGTDGIRGRVGVAPMTPAFALRLGWAAGRVLGRGEGATVLIGKDTRRSGYLFESALEAGLAAAGIQVRLLGPLPTPAIAYLTKAVGAQAGVVISASHNPHYDNGVKFFGADGGKLSEAQEAEIEALLDDEPGCVEPEKVGKASRINDAVGRYVEYCKSRYDGPSMSGLRIVLDCANGAAYRAAPSVFTELGAQVRAIGVSPNGLNINDGCGSTHLEPLQAAVVEQAADLGIALDGDGDRCLMVDAQGNAVDGDQMLYVIARHQLARGGLTGPVVGTVMSNLGLEQAIRAMGLDFERSAVGDRYVFERLLATGGRLGGETSGHILSLDKAGTGDGIVSALQVLAAALLDGRSLGDIVSGMRQFPQVLINVKLAQRSDAKLDTPAIRASMADAERELGVRGRVLLRASGTEPLIRVMVESDDEALSRRIAEAIADSVRATAPA